MQVIDEWLENGLSVVECAKRIEAETGMPIDRNTIYNWLWKREDQRKAEASA
jgi:IS30 family transposase